MTTASPVQSRAHPPAEALLASYPDGSLVALSLSEPGRTYRVQLAPLACECPGFQFRGCCYHVRAAVERFGLQAESPEEPEYVCYSCGAPWSLATGTLSEQGRHICADVSVCFRTASGIRRAYRGGF